MQILGIGTDIIEIERIKQAALSNPRFCNKIFTQREVDYCMGKINCYPHLAARFAAKEAVAKAIGRSLSWQDVEIVSKENGRPYVELTGKAKAIASGCAILVTLSHCRAYATATAVLVRNDG